MCCCQFKGSCEAEKSKGKRGSTVLRIYHLAAISLQKMPGSVEGPGKPFPFLLLHDARLRPALVQVTLSSVLPCHDAPNLIPHHVQEPCQEKPSRQRRWALARSTTCSPMTALGQRPATLQPDWIAWLCQPAAHIMHSPGENLSESDSSDKQNKTKDFICNLPPCHIRVFLLAALHIPALALTSRSDVSPAARATKNSRAERAAPTACSNQTSWLRQPHQGFDPAPCPGSRANHPLLKRQPQE